MAFFVLGVSSDEERPHRLFVLLLTLLLTLGIFTPDGIYIFKFKK